PVCVPNNYEGGEAAIWYGHRGPVTAEVDDVFLDGWSELFGLRMTVRRWLLKIISVLLGKRRWP
ncbi:MAG TPA: hypothetical protein VJ276_25935, partial [Thermoanaerobaculia bacterium]|nr:hypothetical protein [Thermoanaerobaculia bacterium]